MKSDEIPIYPVVAYDVGPVQHYGVVVLRPHYLPDGGKTPEEAVLSRHYAFTTYQAEELVRSLQAAIKRLRAWERMPPSQSMN